MNNGNYRGYGQNVNPNPYQHNNNFNNQFFIRPKTPVEIETENIGDLAKSHAKVLFTNIIAANVLAFIIILIFVMLNIDITNFSNTEIMLEGIPIFTITAISTAVGSLMAILGYYRGQKGWLKRLTVQENSDWKNSIKPKSLFTLSLLVLGGNYVIGILVSLVETVLTKIGIDITVQNTLENISSIKGIEKISLIVLVMVFAPIFEEIIFRGIILTPLRRYGDKFAIIVSAFLFGLTHGNLQQMLPTFVIALVLGYVTVKTNSIIPAIILHFINNLYALFSTYTLNYFFPEGTKFTSIVMTGKILIIIMYAIMIIAILYTLAKFITRKKWISFDNVEQIPEIYQPAMKKSIYFKNGAMMTYVIIFGLVIIFMLLGNVILSNVKL